MAWHAFKKLGNDIEHSYFSENKMFKNLITSDKLAMPNEFTAKINRK